MEDRLNHDDQEKNELYGSVVRAGKRTYFFDVRETKGNDYYLTITESKRRYNDDGTFSYQKHKIFLYKEDFEKFTDALTDAIGHLNELKNNAPASPEKSNNDSYTDVNFDDLG
jgi:hypothetical protein